jgi:uncharacterized LabA/DUF88 family protein
LKERCLVERNEVRPKKSRIAVLVDYDNFQSHCNYHGIAVSPKILMQHVRKLGKPVWTEMFVNAQSLSPREEADWFAEFNISHCPVLESGGRSRKDTVDQRILHVLYSIDVDVVVLCTLDKDFISAIGKVKNEGAKVYLMIPTMHEQKTTLARYVDKENVLVYQKDQLNDAFPAVAELFTASVFDSSDEKIKKELDRLRLVIRLLETGVEISKNRYGFKRIADTLEKCPDIKSAGIDRDAVYRYLRFLHNRSVLSKILDKRGSGVDEVWGQPDSQQPREYNGSPVYWRLNLEHPFTRTVFPEFVIEPPMAQKADNPIVVPSQEPTQQQELEEIEIIIDIEEEDVVAVNTETAMCAT